MGNDHSFWQKVFEILEHYLTKWKKTLVIVVGKSSHRKQIHSSYDSSPVWEMIIHFGNKCLKGVRALRGYFGPHMRSKNKSCSSQVSSY